MRWTDTHFGSAIYDDAGQIIAQVWLLGAGNASAQWFNGMKWDNSDQSKLVHEPQTSRWFATVGAAKCAIEEALAELQRKSVKVAKLLDDSGRPIREPVAVPASVSFDAREGVAQAWAADGRTLIAELVKARVVWMGAAGTRLEGMEPFEGPDGTQYRAMEWQQIY